MFLARNAGSLFPGAAFGVAHCNFSLRGEESDGDEKFVRDWCREAGIECFVKRFDTMAFALERGFSVEMAARSLRYDWFAQLCREHGFDAVAVAHNADDNAETLLLNLVRGCGPAGAAGMQREFTFSSGLRVLRPLLGISREEIRRSAEAEGWTWREDSTNSEDFCKRNVIRHKVLPELKGLNPSLLETFSEDMENFRQAADVADAWFAGMLPNFDCDHIDTVKLLGSDNWEYLLFRLTAGRISRDARESLRQALAAGAHIAGKRFGPYLASASHLDYLPDAGAEESPAPITVSGPGTYAFNGRRFEIRLMDRAAVGEPKAPHGVLFANADALPFPFILRCPAEGDFIRPLGLDGRRKKLSDLFTDLKYDAPLKRSAVVAAKDGSKEAAAVLCVRINENLRVTPETSTVICIRELI